MNADVWKTPDGRIGTEIGRTVTFDQRELVLLVIPDEGFPLRRSFLSGDLTPEPARYEGARGGRVDG